MYNVFGSGISYSLGNVPAGSDMQLRVTTSNGFIDDYAVVRNRTTAPTVSPLSRSASSLTGEEQDLSRVPVDAELFDASKSYRGEWVKYEDGLIGQAYTIQPDFTAEDYAAILPGWIQVPQLKDVGTGAPGLELLPSDPANAVAERSAVEQFMATFA